MEVMADGVSNIEKNNFSTVQTVAVYDGTDTVDLSANYWGGVAPDYTVSAGATTCDTYYTDAAMTTLAYTTTTTSLGGKEYTTSSLMANSITTNSANKVKTATLVSPEDLVALQAMISDGQTAAFEGNGSTITLGADIDMADTEWTPIGTMWMTFDGSNHTISNLTDSLFAYLGGATIQNLTIDGSTISNATAGILAGNLEGVTLSNVEIKGDNTVTYDSEGWHVHGNDHTGAGVLCALDAGVTIGDNVKITGTVTVNYNGVQFKFGDNYILNEDLITVMYGAKCNGSASDTSGIDVSSGSIATTGSYTWYTGQ